MAKKPFVVVSAIWTPVVRDALGKVVKYSRPIKKTGHFVRATSLEKAVAEIEPTLGRGRKVWLVRGIGRIYNDQTQKLVEACFAANGVV